MIVTVIALSATACTGTRPSLDRPTELMPRVTPTIAGKVATADPETATISIVATATTDRVGVYESPRSGVAARSLPSPNPDGAPLVFLVDHLDGDWLRVLLPVRPNGSTGWIRASDVRLTRHTFHIEVRLTEFRILVRRGTTVVLDAPIGVAKDNTPTPGGRYYTTELLRPPTANTVYGTYAYGLSGFSDVLESFNGGPGQLGIHGTNDPSSIGTKASSGCVRMNNADIDRLASMLPVGVPVDVIA